MKEVWVVKRIQMTLLEKPRYFSASTSASSAPTIYTSHGKAEGRRKTLDVDRHGNDRRQWEVKRWTITEEQFA